MMPNGERKKKRPSYRISKAGEREPIASTDTYARHQVALTRFTAHCAEYSRATDVTDVKHAHPLCYLHDHPSTCAGRYIGASRYLRCTPMTELKYPDLITIEEVLRPAEPWYTSHPFDEFLCITHPKADTLVGAIVTQINSVRHRQRVRSTRAEERFRCAINLICANLYAANQKDYFCQVGFNMGSGHLSRQSRYRNPSLSYCMFADACRGLLELGYAVEERKGWYDQEIHRGYNTKIRATDKLIDLIRDILTPAETIITGHQPFETIHLKDSNKELIEYVDTPETVRMRNSIGIINDYLSRPRLELSLDDDLKERLQRRLELDPKKELIDPTMRTLYRVFNNGSFEQGGRFYGGWWQAVPHEFRPYITIDGETTVECDYSALHPRMLYAMEGLPQPDDPYIIPEICDLHPGARSMIKAAVNRLINAREKRVREPPEYKPYGFGMSWGEFLDFVASRRPELAKYFGSGMGIRLQFNDARMAEHIMLPLLEKGITCLPIHDSFIVQKRHWDDLLTTMQEAALQIVGVVIPVKTICGLTRPPPKKTGAAMHITCGL